MPTKMSLVVHFHLIYSQTCVKRPYKTIYILAFQTGGSLLLHENSAESSAQTDLTVKEPRCEKTGLWGVPTRSDTNRAVQPQKMARGLKFRI